MCKAHFGTDDVLIDGFRLNPVHIIIEPVVANTEFDFYLDTCKDCYLLRIRNIPNNTITLCKHDTHYFDFFILS